MRLQIAIALLCVLLIPFGEASAEEHAELFGMVVVIDPGHGGVDPGAHGEFSGPNGNVTIREAEYVYDVACRLWHMVRQYDAIAVMTTWDRERGCARDARPQNHAIPADREEEFVLDRTLVRAGAAGLQKRVAFANQMLKKYPHHRVVFLSLHFDATGNNNLEGVHFIAPEGEERELVTYLVDQFRADNRLRSLDGEEYHPVTVSGDPANGMRRIYILSPRTNKVFQRVLIELGNFNNPDDVWRIRDYTVRERFAQLITRALIRVNELPASRAR